MKLVLAVSLCFIYFFSVSTAQRYNCVNQTEPSGVISFNSKSYEKIEVCWIIEVPEGSYVRIDLNDINLQGKECSSTYIKITVVGGNEEYTFCSQDKKGKPIIALNDVKIAFCQDYYGYTTSIYTTFRYTTYRYRQTTYAYSLSFRLNYTRESLICAQKNSFRCSEQQCIHGHQVCDEIKDCENGADEASCETGVGAIRGVNASRKSIITWLKRQRSDAHGWGKNTHRAITALHLSGGARFQDGDLQLNLMAKQLELQTAVALLRNSSDLISVNELSMFINALSVTCHSPRQFYGHDLLKILSERVLTLSSPGPGAYLTLCNANWTLSEFQIRSLLNILDKHSGYPFHSDFQAMSVMALTCVKNKINSFYNIHNASEIYNDTVKDFISRQQPDGSFGNIYTTALITQALLSSGQESNKAWDLTATIEYLIMELNSSSIDFLSAYYIAPIFNGKSLVDVGTVNCVKTRKEGEDEEISEIINKFGGKMRVKYYLYIGDQKDIIHSIYLRMPENSSAYDVMRVAQVVDHKYKFHHNDMSDHVYVYEIAGITNDPEAGKFWLLYTRDSSVNGTLKHYIESPDKVLLNDEDHLIMWYKTAHI